MNLFYSKEEEWLLSLGPHVKDTKPADYISRKWYEFPEIKQLMVKSDCGFEKEEDKND